MDDRPIETILQDASHVEKPESKALRLKALKIIKLSVDSPKRLIDLPITLLDLLTTVIKPLFSGSLHPKLTSTGRKVLVKDNLPGSIIDRFSTFELEDGTNRPLWKNGWTPRLLGHMLSLYTEIGSTDDDAGFELRKKTIEGHFYLLVPPILKQLDDMQISYKAGGCRCLQLLCSDLYTVQSTILKRSGLMDVFIEALKNDFSMLPTLTPEDESLELYKALYPAYKTLVQAFGQDASTDRPSSIRGIVPKAESEDGKREYYLTLILRHQLIHALMHLSTGIGAGSTMSVPLSTFLISQIGWIVSDMGFSAVMHLQSLLPLLRNILSDPFGTGAPDMLLETIKALREIVQICWPRIKEKWWEECLRGIVTCWLNICDDQADLQPEHDPRRDSRLNDVKHQLQIVACLLKDVVGVEFTQSALDFTSEAAELSGLFTLSLQQKNLKPTNRPLISELDDSKT